MNRRYSIPIPAVSVAITTYEKVSLTDWIPSVTHTFYGNTIEEAYSILNAHRKSDSFFNGSFGGHWISPNNVEIILRNSEIEVSNHQK